IRIEVALGSKTSGTQPSSGAKGGQGKRKGEQEKRDRTCRNCGRTFQGQWRDHAPNCPAKKPTAPSTPSLPPAPTTTKPMGNGASGGSKTFTGNCYNCGQPGHTKDKCPKLNKAVRTVESDTSESDTKCNDNTDNKDTHVHTLAAVGVQADHSMGVAAQAGPNPSIL